MDYYSHWVTCPNGCFILQGTTIVCTTWWVVQTMGKGRWAGAKTVCRCSSSSPKPRVSHPRPPRHPTSIVTWESSSNSRWCRISKVGHQYLNLWSEFRFLFMTTFYLFIEKWINTRVLSILFILCIVCKIFHFLVASSRKNEPRQICIWYIKIE